MDLSKSDPMAISRQERLLILFYLLGYSRFRNLLFLARRKPVARFLTFHDVPPSTLGRFEANLRFLRKKTNVISLDDFFQGRVSYEKINTVITFDDGYKSWLTSAIPILQELKLPGTFFISSSFIRSSPDHKGQAGKSGLRTRSGHPPMTGSLDREDVKRITEYGFTVGGHTKSHCRLSEVQDGAQVRDEIVDNKNSLEGITGHEVTYFAYPFGATDNPRVSLAKILREAGYKGALTTISGFNTSTTDPYRLHRELTRASMHSWTFRAKVYGNVDALRHLEILYAKIRAK